MEKDAAHWTNNECTTCGVRPITSAAHDMKDTTKPKDTHRVYEPTGVTKYGCDDHPVHSSIRHN